MKMKRMNRMKRMMRMKTDDQDELDEQDERIKMNVTYGNMNMVRVSRMISMSIILTTFPVGLLVLVPSHIIHGESGAQDADKDI